MASFYRGDDEVKRAVEAETRCDPQVDTDHITVDGDGSQVIPKGIALRVGRTRCDDSGERDPHRGVTGRSVLDANAQP